jgi:hypothetical protein
MPPKRRCSARNQSTNSPAEALGEQEGCRQRLESGVSCFIKSCARRRLILIVRLLAVERTSAIKNIDAREPHPSVAVAVIHYRTFASHADRHLAAWSWLYFVDALGLRLALQSMLATSAAGEQWRGSQLLGCCLSCIHSHFLAVA